MDSRKVAKNMPACVFGCSFALVDCSLVILIEFAEEGASDVGQARLGAVL
jgi:hypothetical protein